VSFFEIGLGPIPWLIVAEMIHPKYVTLSMSVCSQLNWVCNFVVGFVFPAMNERLGYLSFAPFGVVLVMTFAYSWLYLPETSSVDPLLATGELEKRRASIDPEFFDGITEELKGSFDNKRAAREWSQATMLIQKEEEELRMQEGYSWNTTAVQKEDSGRGSKWLGGFTAAA